MIDLLNFFLIQIQQILISIFTFIGNAVQTLKSKDSVKVLTVRGTSFEAETLEGGSTPQEKGPVGDYKSKTSEFVGQELSKSDRPELTGAKIIISGGKTILFIVFRQD